MRAKILRISIDSVISLFVLANKTHEWIALPVIKDLPEGYEIIGVHTDPYITSCFLIVVKHESFDDVPAGQKLPEVMGALEQMTSLYKRATQEDCDIHNLKIEIRNLEADNNFLRHQLRAKDAN